MTDPSYPQGPQPGWGPSPGQAPEAQPASGPAPGAQPGWSAPPAAQPAWASGPPGGQFPGAVPPGYFQDPGSGLTLPVGTDLASVGRRIGAFFLAFPLAIVTLGIGYVIWGLIVWGRGQTPALQVLGMRCYRPETGRVAGWGWMALRETVGRFVDAIFSVITYLVSFIFFLARGDHRCLHDLVAGTVVLRDPDKVLAKQS
jgi:uncharacterized RDD family membrane protein YckC